MEQQREQRRDQMVRRPLYVYNLPSDILTTLQQKDGVVPDIPEEQDNEAKAEHDGTRSDGATSTTACSLCDQLFSTVEEQRSHIRSDIHSYNLKLKLRGLEPVSEVEFETLVKDLDESLSGSDESESDDDQGPAGRNETTLVALLKKRAAKSTQEGEDGAYLGSQKDSSSKQPLVWFTSPTVPPNSYLGVYKAIFTAEEQNNNGNFVETIKKKQLQPRMPIKHSSNNGEVSKPTSESIGPHMFMCMIGGGHFAAMVVSMVPKQSGSSATGPLAKEATVIAHKTFHRYTTRRKQGGSQSANDSSKGAAHSAGASIRRYNEVALNDEVRLLLTEWKSLIDTSELLFVRATGNTNRRTLFGPYEGQVLQPNDPRIRSIPFNTRRATQKELMRSFIELTRVKVREFDEQPPATQPSDSLPKTDTSQSSTKGSSTATKPAFSDEEETFILHTTQIQALIRRSKLPALLSYLKNNSLDADFRFYPPSAPQNFHTPTPLHFAASLNNPVVVTGLLVKAHANPEALNSDGKPPFDLAGDRSTRDAFRLARSRLATASPPVTWDWEKTHIPSPLTDADVETRRAEESLGQKREEEDRRKAETERLKNEGPKVTESGPLGKSASMGRALAMEAARKTAQEKREEESRGLTPEMRLKLDRERRARAAEERFKAMQANKVLIANRGEIALRVGRTAAESGIRCTTLYTDPDAHSQHALSSPFAVNLGQASAYLDGERIIAVAKEQGCQALHPGYGFLSENSAFAKRCVEEGLVFIGPPWKAIEAMGNKSRSKDIMIKAGVPCIPGYHGANQDPENLLEESRKIGFPVLVKAVRGGGGKGMRIAMNEAEFLDKLESAKSEGRNSFGDDEMLVEKYITTPRHIEVQVFADKHGNAVALGERDCSLQRRHQKILEEAPAPNLPEEIRQDLWEKARAAALAVGYEGAGTVEFIFDNDSNQFFFMEMNTRLQVEHPVTEVVTGEDLVSWQFKVAAGEPLPLTQEAIAKRISERGWAIEARIYAENPDQDFMPDSGKLTHLRTPQITDNVRIDAGFVEGDTISSNYDGMIAKLIVSGETRDIAIQRMYSALQDYEVVGLSTNIEFLKKICLSPGFAAGDVETGYIKKNHDELFEKEAVENTSFAQAALALFTKDATTSNSLARAGPHGNEADLSTILGERQFRFSLLSGSEPIDVTVTVKQSFRNIFDVSVDGPGIKESYSNVTCESIESSVTSYFPHTRVKSTVVRDGDNITMFQKGKMIKLRLAQPLWYEKALGIKDVANSVLAPMPCKILKNEVNEGDIVEKDAALVVIESMKMETIIRSPQRGTVAKLVHKPGDICKAGTVLVLFEEAE
ncbi:hypothetical protein V492_07797 [Pseudogymnoascus sp. VKM F-4246]|nr:hypothetical protein V492_07797 [Pseudogymnoascus sp. VKM F-4246]